MTKTQQLARYISDSIEKCGRRHREIAKDAGFESPTIISMIKKGHTKLPIARVPDFAKAIDVDPHDLLDRCLEAYQPEIHAVISALAPSVLVSQDELKIIQMLRGAARSGVFD